MTWTFQTSFTSSTTISFPFQLYNNQQHSFTRYLLSSQSKKDSNWQINYWGKVTFSTFELESFINGVVDPIGVRFLLNLLIKKTLFFIQFNSQNVSFCIFQHKILAGWPEFFVETMSMCFSEMFQRSNNDIYYNECWNIGFLGL